MKKFNKSLAIILVFILSLAMSIPALAQASTEDYVEMFKGNISPRAISFATDYASLKNALTSGSSNIVILNSFEFSGTLDVNHSVEFAAPAPVVLKATTEDTHFNITANNVTLTFQNVELNGNNVGGGIYSGSNSITLIDAIVRHCKGAGVAGNLNSGSITIDGGEYSYNSGRGISGCTVQMLDGLITQNNDGGVQAGKSNIGCFYMRDGTITRNNTTGYGGGVLGSILMTGGTISYNTAEYGGGISVGNYGVATFYGVSINNGTIIGNTARNGGGIYLQSTNPSRGTITNCTISGNKATNYGGGIFSHGCAVYAESTAISFNEAPRGSGVGLSYYKSYGEFYMTDDCQMIGNDIANEYYVM